MSPELEYALRKRCNCECTGLGLIEQVQAEISAAQHRGRIAGLQEAYNLLVDPESGTCGDILREAIRALDGKFGGDA